MKLAVALAWTICLMLAVPLFAGESYEIELKDGSVVQAEIVSLEADHYNLRSEGLGNFRVEKGKVKSLRIRGAESAPVGTAKNNQPANEQLKGLQQSMLTDSKTLEKVIGLQNDPDVQAVLNDPEIMNAVMSGNISAITSNPKFLKLLDKPEVQEISRAGLK